MKKILYNILGTILLLTGTSCGGFLEVELDDEIIATEALSSRETLEAAVIGLYDNLQSGSLYGGDVTVAGSLLSGDAIATGFQPFYEELAEAKVPATNAYVENTWIDFYNIVNSANNILNSIDGIDGISQEERNQFEGTAHFMRAFSFFSLLCQYGYFFDLESSYGIPLFTEVLDRSSALNVGRSTVSESYAQIIADLEAANSLTTQSPGRFFVNKAAVQALWARVYLYQKDYANAFLLADNIIKSGEYSLEENYADLFDDSGNSDEILFELAYNEQDGNDLARLLMVTGSNEVSVADALAEAYDEADTRLELFVRRFGVYRCTKYGDAVTAIATNVPLFRLGELYLIRAEAQAFEQGIAAALPDLNAVRERAWAGSAISEDDVADIDAFLALILTERRLELAFEGQYWFDLVRLGQAEEARDIASYRRVLPIPVREVQISDGLIEQNPGYE
jgi:hypothetical protein